MIPVNIGSGNGLVLNSRQLHKLMLIKIYGLNELTSLQYSRRECLPSWYPTNLFIVKLWLQNAALLNIAWCLISVVLMLTILVYIINEKIHMFMKK